MNGLFGFVADALRAAVFSLNLDRETEQLALRAFSKLLWLQNDLIDRHDANLAAAEEEVALGG
jgi:hypothetical protein